MSAALEFVDAEEDVFFPRHLAIALLGDEARLRIWRFLRETVTLQPLNPDLLREARRCVAPALKAAQLNNRLFTDHWITCDESNNRMDDGQLIIGLRFQPRGWAFYKHERIELGPDGDRWLR